MTGDFSKLADEQGIPVRFKVATFTSLVLLIITIGTLFATVGGRAEKLESLDIRTTALEKLPPRIDRVEVKIEGLQKSLDAIEKKVDRILERFN